MVDRSMVVSFAAVGREGASACYQPIADMVLLHRHSGPKTGFVQQRITRD